MQQLWTTLLDRMSKNGQHVSLVLIQRVRDMCTVHTVSCWQTVKVDVQTQTDAGHHWSDDPAALQSLPPTHRHTDRHTDRQTYRDTHRQTYRDTHRHTHTDNVMHSAETVCATKSKAGLSAETESQQCLGRRCYRGSKSRPAFPNLPAHLISFNFKPCRVSISGPTVYIHICSQLPPYTLQPLQLKLCDLLSTIPKFSNCRPLKQKVHQLLSAETECPPKVPIYPHSGLKLKSKFGRPLTQTQVVDVQLTATELTRDTSQLQLQQRPVDR